MTNVLYRVAPFELQLMVFDYDEAGLISDVDWAWERPGFVATPSGVPLWDRDATYLRAFSLTWPPDAASPVPDWFALPYVCDDRRR